MRAATVVVINDALHDERALGLVGGQKRWPTFASYPLSRSCSGGIACGFILENRSFAVRGGLPLPFLWIFLPLTEACSLSFEGITATAVTTAAPDSDVFRFFATRVSSFEINATGTLRDLAEVALSLMETLTETRVVSASDSDSELEDELDSESDELPPFFGTTLATGFLSDEDSDSEELDSESDESPPFFGATLATGFLSDEDSESEELDSESDESPPFFGIALMTGFSSDEDSDVESSESESESELLLMDSFFGGALDLTAGALSSITG